MPKFLPLIVLFFLFLYPTPSTLNPIFARTTPEDIVNSKKATYEQRVKNYSQINRQKLEDLSKKIAQVNQKRTDELNLIIQTQGLILDEYVKRFNIEEDGGKDGIHRNLGDSAANARYWITYAHEAVAYQAAKMYVFNLTTEANIKNDALNTVNLFQSDLNSAKLKVIKSQNILLEVVK